MIKSTWWNDMTKEMKREWLDAQKGKAKPLPKKIKREEE
jgi:hypothetical protein